MLIFKPQCILYSEHVTHISNAGRTANFPIGESQPDRASLYLNRWQLNAVPSISVGCCYLIFSLRWQDSQILQ